MKTGLSDTSREAARANHTARQLALAGLAQRHPNEPIERLRRRLFDLVLGSELAESAYGPLE